MDDREASTDERLCAERGKGVLQHGGARRIGIDPDTNEFVVFDRTAGDDYHGHVRQLDRLHQDMKNALIKAKKADIKDNILERKSEPSLPSPLNQPR
ncbi:hypothetical protein [Pseudomonas chlororaphis]|uniref:hypothetical protein n=1 Tax=Pseudomonas chlororaphis TaxID=587753 RepID=UPI001E451BDA|nr:hypothetical protein [Pseudomonas chlororaphis]